MNDDLALFYTALRNVDFSIVSNCNDDNCAEIKFVNERSFAYELYRQWQTIIDDTPNYDLIVNAEVVKKISNDAFINELRKIFPDAKDEKRFYPDLVLHKSQFNPDDKNQNLICEIKVNKNQDFKTSSDDILKDFKKLVAYMSYNTLLLNPFSYGVFVYVNGSRQDIKDSLNGADIPDEKKTCLFCALYNIVKTENQGHYDIEIKVELKSLEEILRG